MRLTAANLRVFFAFPIVSLSRERGEEWGREEQRSAATARNRNRNLDGFSERDPNPDPSSFLQPCLLFKSSESPRPRSLHPSPCPSPAEDVCRARCALALLPPPPVLEPMALKSLPSVTFPPQFWKEPKTATRYVSALISFNARTPLSLFLRLREFARGRLSCQGGTRLADTSSHLLPNLLPPDEHTSPQASSRARGTSEWRPGRRRTRSRPSRSS